MEEKLDKLERGTLKAAAVFGIVYSVVEIANTYASNHSPACYVLLGTLMALSTYLLRKTMQEEKHEEEER